MHLKKLIIVMITSITGAMAAITLAIGFTFLISLAICLGFHPEAAMATEYAAAVIGVVWAGALVARVGLTASVGAGALVGLTWALAWFYLMSRFNIHLWLTEALPSITWYHLLSWSSSPALGLLGGLLRLRFRGVLIHTVPLVMLILVMLTHLLLVHRPGNYTISNGVNLKVEKPHMDGTTVRLFTVDFTANSKLQAGIYDQDMHDAAPYNDKIACYLGTPSPTVFERLGEKTLFLVNAGFFTWDKNRIASHVAPVVVDRRAYYSVSDNPDVWTFGWKKHGDVPEFRLLKGVTFENLTKKFDYALGLARPLIVNGKSLELKPGPGVTRLKCSRVSLAWSNPHQLNILVVRDPDGEMASIARMKRKERQVGGWDLPQIQQFWKRKGMANALILDSGDSTELVYQGPHRTIGVSSARFSRTLGYLRDRPLRIWVPILPARHSNVGICNYIYIQRGDQ